MRSVTIPGVGTVRVLWGGGLVLAPVLALALAPAALAQTDPMGSVTTRDARVTGGLEVQGDTTRLLTNVSVTAHDHAAPITLQRGGGVLVCSTSEFHLLRSGAAGALIFGLDRGAIELVSQSRPQDVVLTPDLKFTPVTKGLLDLKLRVTREGDTCIDNAGSAAPVLNVTDPFSSASYRVLPGQHMMFIKGDLHKVVDHERSSCGCPSTPEPQVAAAPSPGQPASPAQAAAAAHPFPEAESVGLAPAAQPSNEAPVGQVGSQVTTGVSYGEGATPPPVAAADAAAGASGVTGVSGASGTTGEETPPAQPGFLHKLGRFFHHLFHPSE
jgi:hypothetical protein